MPAPKVTTNVIDQSTRVSSVGTYNSAIVISATKGKVNVPILVTSQTDFLRKYTPDEKIEIGMDGAYYEAYQYLAQQSNLYVVRAAHTEQVSGGTEEVALYGGCKFQKSTSSNANTALSTGLTNPASYTPSGDEVLLITGTNQGKYNDKLAMIIITDEEEVKLDGAFLAKIYKKDSNGTLVLMETFTCSLNPSLKNGYGVNCFVDNVLNASNYVDGISYGEKQTVYTVTATATGSGQGETYTYTGYTTISASVAITDLYKTPYLANKLEYATVDEEGNPLSYTCTVGTSNEYYPLPKASSKDSNGNYIPLFLAGGADGSNSYQTADKCKAVATLNNINDINIQLILDGGCAEAQFQKKILEVCEAREDSCHGILCTPVADEIGQGTSGDALTDIKNYRNSTLNTNTTNLELYTPHQVYYDEFNDNNVYISPGPYVASLIMKYANELGWHWAVAGYNRGIINSVDVAATFAPSIVDQFSDAQINTIIKDPGKGNVIWDELTMLSQAQDMQDAHISRYINIYLRPRLKEALKAFLFEFNDDQTREIIVQMIDSFMQPQQASRACYSYKIVCDETNNLPSDIQNNILNCWLYIKPTKIAKFIRQSIVITPYAVELESIG